MTSPDARLKPGLAVFALDGDTIQIGTAPPVVIEDLTREQAQYVASLEGPARHALPADSTQDSHAELRQRLDSLGLLSTMDPTRNESDSFSLCIVGADTLGTAVGEIAAQAGVDRVVFDDSRPVPTRNALVPGPDATLGQAAARLVNARVPHSARAEHRAGAFGSHDIAVVVAHIALTMEIVSQLTANDTPHLPVLTDERGITVGPLVTPGEGPCLLCVGIWRTELDAHWPLVALQCNDARPTFAPSPLREIAAGVAVDMVKRFMATQAPDARQWRIENSAAGPCVTSRPVTQHRSCGCSNQLVLGDEFKDLEAVLFKL